MITEELKIKIDVDADTRDAQKLKNELKGIEGAAGGASGSTGEMATSLESLHNSMRMVAGLEFADLMLENKNALSNFAKSINNAFDMSLTGVEGLADSLDHLKNSVSMVNPFSKFYEDVEWKGFKQAIGDAKDELKEAKDAGVAFGKEVGTAFRNLHNETRVLRTAIGALALAMVPIAGVMSAFSSSALGKDIYNTAQRVGMGTAKFQEWDYIVQQTGADVSDLIGAQQTLTEAQIDVAEGAEDIIAAFERIGLSADEVVGMSRQELFEKTVAGLQNIENATERAAVGYRLLSEDASTLSALLGMSNEQTRQLADNYQYLGAIMSEELIGKSLRFQGALANLRAAFRGITNTLAEIFLPVLTTVVNAVTKAIAIINMFLRTLFGLELTTSESGTNSSVGAGISGFGAMTDSIEEAEGAAQKLRRTLMGFDELNVLQNPNVGGSGGGAGGAGGGIGDIGGGGLADVGGGLFNPENLNLDGWHDAFTKWEGIIQTLIPVAMIGIGAVGAVWCLLHGNWVGALAFATMAGIGLAAADSADTWGQLLGIFEKHNLAIIPIAMIGLGAVGAIMCALRGNWVGAMAFAALAGMSLLTVTAGDGFSIDTVKTIFDELKDYAIPVVCLLGAMVAGFMGNLPVAAALLATAGVTGVLTWTGGGSLWDGIVKTVSGILPDLKKYAIPLIALSAAIVAALMGNLPAAAVLLGVAAVTNFITFSTDGAFWTGLIDGIKKAWDNITTWFKANVGPKFTKEFWASKFNTIKEGLSTKLSETRTTAMNGWNNIRDYFNANIAPKFTAAYWTAKFESIKTGLQTKLGETRTTMMNAWNSIREYYNANIAPKFTSKYWSGKFDSIRAALGTKLSEARTTVINGWNSVKDYYNKNIAPKFTANYWTTKFNSIRDGAKAAFNGVIAVVEKAVNGIVNKMNTLSWKIPDWVPQYGGKKFGFNLKAIKIPRLAEGGIAMSSTLANIGENGREAVLPLDNNTEWMDALADKIAARSQGPTKLVLKVGEKELGWASLRGINQITKQTGELQLVL